MVVEYRDNTPFEGDNHTVGELAKAIRTKMYGVDVRESIAQAVEKMENWTKGNNIGNIIATPTKVFANLSALQSAYPNGADGVMLTVDNGHKYFWSNNQWTDGGVYQSDGNAEVEDSRTFSRGIMNKTAPTLTERLASEFRYVDKSIIGTQSDLAQFDVRKYASYNTRCFGYSTTSYVPQTDYLDGAVFIDIPVTDMPSKLTFTPTTANSQKMIIYTENTRAQNFNSFTGNETFASTYNRYQSNADGSVTVNKYGLLNGGFHRLALVTDDISTIKVGDVKFNDLTLIKLAELVTNAEKALKEANLTAVKALSENSYTRTKNKQMPSYQSNKTPNVEDFTGYDVLTFRVSDMPEFVRFDFEENVLQKFIAYTPNSKAYNIASMADKTYNDTTGMIQVTNGVATLSKVGLLANGYEYVAVGVKNTAYVYDVTDEIVESKPQNTLDVDTKTQFGHRLTDYNTSTKLPRTEASGLANTITLSLDDMPAYIRFKPATNSTQKVIFYKQNQAASNYANVVGKTFGNSYALMNYDGEWLTIQKYGLINNGVDHIAFAVDLSSPWVVDYSDEMTKKLESTPNLATVGKLAVIGDSYSTGTLFLNSAWGGNPELAWGRNISKKYNLDYDQFSIGGINAKNWLTNASGLPALKSKTPADLYVIALGINDASTYKADSSYLGTTADIGTNAQTFYGSYSKIISEIKSHAPNAKIVCLGLAHELNPQFDAITQAIRKIAEAEQVAYIDEKDDGFFRSFEWWDTMSGGHPIAWGYSEMASAIERLLGKAMLDNFEYFKNYRWQQ